LARRRLASTPSDNPMTTFAKVYHMLFHNLEIEKCGSPPIILAKLLKGFVSLKWRTKKKREKVSRFSQSETVKHPEILN
jgi:hypothetical protein